MRSFDQLAEQLRRIDGRGYRAYKDIQGAYADRNLELHVDHVQGDPFAAPSRVRLVVPRAVAAFPESLWDNRVRRVALADFLIREFASGCERVAQRCGSGKSGLIDIDRPGQQVLERSACRVDEGGVELRISVGLPAAGRRVLGRQAAQLLLDELPALAADVACYDQLDAQEIAAHVNVVEDAHSLRGQLDDADLVAFIADGAILPRRSGVDQQPMAGQQVVAFRSPAALRVELSLPHHGPVSGMGIGRGVSLIVGGGYHGKSTLLSALQHGIYAHRPGDGRERVASNARAVKIRAEDGRRVEKVDISPFINNLPHGRDTQRFCSDDASGSTSQAASLIEALEAGAELLLIDEDTAATNFMIRDHRMQQLVAKDQEPITPFVDKVRQLYEERGVSTVLVAGGSGDYFDVADRVIQLDAYCPRDVSALAKKIAEEPTGRHDEGGRSFGGMTKRIPLGKSVDASRGRHEAKIGARGLGCIQLGRHDIDVSAVAELVSSSQLRAIGHALHHASRKHMDGKLCISELLDAVERDLAARGLDALTRHPLGQLAEFRRFELAAALNRLRTLEVR